MTDENLPAVRDNASRIVTDVPCPFCGCVCDDLQVSVTSGRVAAAEGACEIARNWFLADRRVEPPSCRVRGSAASYEDALGQAAEMLIAARYPLIYGLSRATCDAQAAAVEIAELVRGVIDTPASRGSLAALQTIGEVTCTLGEIRNRADLIVAWGVDPITTHPRFFERYGPISPQSQLIVVDSRASATSAIAHRRIVIRAGSDFEAAAVIRAIAKGINLDAAMIVERTGVSLPVWQVLLERMKNARFGVLIAAESNDSPAARRLCGALAALVCDLNLHTRFVSLGLRSGGNVVGAENVLAWRTGHPTAIDFSHSGPRSNPDEFTAERLLASGEIDAALVICDDPLSHWNSAAKERFHAIPTIALDWQDTPTMKAAQVAIPIATIGVESGGTVFRMDGVPLALRPVVPARGPTDYEGLRRLAAALRGTQHI
ncbi:MAG TPA: formylmethanofuran dehydrogenase subunit B [Pirellulales bacterium]|jgi:formylmethanofuran dehydrogenase subunit B|nr:formylmethanofuran dehydrogenase subunit B [Pirellulales bacterium]